MLPGNKHSYLASQSEARMILPLISPSLYVFHSVTHLNILTSTICTNSLQNILLFIFFVTAKENFCNGQDIVC